MIFINKKTNKQSNFFRKFKQRRGIALLFSIIVSSILFTVAAGVINISLKELNFSTSAKGSNDALFAADSGAECAFYNDSPSELSFPTSSKIPDAPNKINCLFGDVPLTSDVSLAPSVLSWNFAFTNLGTTGQACSKVAVTKTFDIDGNLTNTQIISKGYNTGGITEDCTASGIGRIERVLELNY